MLISGCIPINPNRIKRLALKHREAKYRNPTRPKDFRLPTIIWFRRTKTFPSPSLSGIGVVERNDEGLERHRGAQSAKRGVPI